MSSYSNVSIMTGPHLRPALMAALKQWGEDREAGSGEFAMLETGGLAMYAGVISGQVNHLLGDGGLESLKAVIRDAVHDSSDRSWQPTSLVVQDEEGEMYPWSFILDSSGTWSG
jgi:hypothetical protein